LRTDGFTLLETLIGVGLAAVLAGTSVTRLVDLVWSARLAGAARTVATALRLARGQAIATDASVEVRFDPVLGQSETWDRTANMLLETRALPPGVAFAALPARNRILFGGLGTADNGTVTLASGPWSRQVVVNQRGRVRVQ